MEKEAYVVMVTDEDSYDSAIATSFTKQGADRAVQDFSTEHKYNPHYRLESLRIYLVPHYEE